MAPSHHTRVVCPRLPGLNPGRRGRHRGITKGITKGGAETGGHRQPAGFQEKARTLVELTVAEIRRLLCRLVLRRRPPRWGEVLSWSLWRRRHQAVAKRCHYKRRGVLLA